MPEHIMGIEIGNSNIKIIEVYKKSTTLMLHQFSLIPTPRGCIKDGIIQDEQPLIKVIEKELSERKYQAKKVAIVVQGSNILIRNVVMDKQPEKIIKQVLELKTEDYLPIQKDDYQIDYKIEREFEEDGVQKVSLLLVAAPNEIVLPVAKLIKTLKLRPILITIPSEALGSAFGDKRRLVFDAPSNIMVIDMGGRSTNITIIVDCNPVLTRSVRFGKEHIDEVVEQKKQSKALTTQDKVVEDYSEVIFKEVEDNIIADAERLIQFYYSNYNTGTIKKVYLIGGGTDITGIRTYIRDALNIETERIRDLDALEEASKVKLEDHKRLFINVLGAVNSL